MTFNRQLFGTDGIRGRSNRDPMTVQNAVRIGQAIASYFLTVNEGSRMAHQNHRPRILMGKDTRLSGYMFESALAAGIMSVGVDVQLVGPLPTPAISFLTTNMRADAGIVLSASHNPYVDNGFKIFGSDGYKLPDSAEVEIERIALSDQSLSCDASLIGKARRIEDASGRYIVFVKNSFPQDLTLEGLRIVLDCANGAAHRVAPTTLEELGAEVITVGTSPNGYNINHKCGSTYPELVQSKVLETRADLGISLDGDADRAIFVDEYGNIIDGDHIIALCALNLKQQNRLKDNSVVVTVMSNLGLEVALREEGIRTVRSQVGDRYVMQQMIEHSLNFGGEASGHLIFRDYTTTGDGLIAAMQVLGIMQRKKQPLSRLSQLVKSYPQMLVNVLVREKPPLESLTRFQEELLEAEERLGGSGRVLVRYSGTEQKARVMVEAKSEELVHELCHRLADVLRAEIGT